MKKTQSTSFDCRKPTRDYIFLNLFILLLIASSGYALPEQDPLEKRITFVKINTPLRQVLQEIESQIGVEFVYSKNFVPVEKTINLQATDEKVAWILEKLFNPLRIGYRVSGTQILLTKKPLVETGTVRGKLTDGSGKPIAYANIVLLSTQYGTVSDEAGLFSLEHIPEGNYTLVVSGVGFETIQKEIAVKGKASVQADVIINEKVSELAEVEVFYQRPYTTKISAVGAKIAMPVQDLPQSIQIINRKALDQLQVVRLEDAIRNVSGLTMETGLGGRTDAYQIRGFRSTRSSIFRNGFRNVTRGYRESVNIERIEVLKGPASVLYGYSDPGGLINLVTKKPLENTAYQVGLTGGSYGLLRPFVDATGPLTADHRLKYRFTGTYERSESFRDFVSVNRYFLSPVITYDFSPKTSLTVEVDYTADKRPSDRGLVVVNKALNVLPINRYLGEPDDMCEYTTLNANYNFLHTVNDHIQIRHAFNFIQATEDRNVVEHSAYVRNSTDRLARRIQIQDTRNYIYDTQTEINMRYATGKAVDHHTLLGFEYLAEGEDLFAKRADLDTVNAINPVYTTKTRPTQLKRVYEDYLEQKSGYAFYVQHFVKILQKLNLVAGLRYDDYKNTYTNRDKDATSEYEGKAWSPRAGLVYQLVKPLAIYGNWSSSFTPLFGRTSDGKNLEPERASQYEVGAKFIGWQDQITATACYFNITKSNILTADPTDPTLSIQVGKARSQGFELDVNGQLLPGWNVITSYAYNDARVTQDNAIRVGTRFRNVGYNTASLWTTYQLPVSPLKGLGVGGGLYHVDERPGDANDSFRLPGYNRLDVTLFYQFKRFQVNLNVHNLTGKQYYEGAGSTLGVMPGAPRNFLATLTAGF